MKNEEIQLKSIGNEYKVVDIFNKALSWKFKNKPLKGGGQTMFCFEIFDQAYKICDNYLRCVLRLLGHALTQQPLILTFIGP